MKQNHIIHNVQLEVAVPNRDKAFQIKDDIASFLTINVFPKLERYIVSIASQLPAHTLQISQLSLVLNEHEIALDGALEESIIQQFKKELDQIIATASNLVVDNENNMTVSLWSRPEKMLRAFIHFLENGQMPWWYVPDNSGNILEPKVFSSIVSHESFAGQLKASLHQSSVRQRIVNQLSDAQLLQICLSLTTGKGQYTTANRTFFKQLSEQKFSDRTAIWTFLLEALVVHLDVSHSNFEQYLLEKIVKLIAVLQITTNTYRQQPILNLFVQVFPFVAINQEVVADFIKEYPAFSYQDAVHQKSNVVESPFQSVQNSRSNESVFSDQKQPIAEVVEGHYVPNAGLVLIHPFISTLFKHCDLIHPKTKTLLDPELCAHLLHYVATGKTNQPESEMIFEKFLCAIPLDQSISRHVKLSRMHKSQANKVIEAVKQNWPSMQAASTALLQNEFFQRSGKMVVNDNTTITIERKTQDILLDKLSWGIGLVKLPWHNQFFYVNW